MSKLRTLVSAAIARATTLAVAVVNRVVAAVAVAPAYKSVGCTILLATAAITTATAGWGLVSGAFYVALAVLAGTILHVATTSEVVLKALDLGAVYSEDEWQVFADDSDLWPNPSGYGPTLAAAIGDWIGRHYK